MSHRARAAAGRHSTKEARVLMAVRQDDSDRGRRGTSEGGGGGVLELL